MAKVFSKSVFVLLLLIAFSKGSCQKRELELNCGHKRSFRGFAINFTADHQKSGFVYEDCNKKSKEVRIFWDNINLFGVAKAQASKKNARNYSKKYQVEYRGTFDCGGLAGWPIPTTSDFLIVIYYDEEAVPLKGYYEIVGEGMLPKQKGYLNFK